MKLIKVWIFINNNTIYSFISIMLFCWVWRQKAEEKMMHLLISWRKIRRKKDPFG